MTRRRQTLLPRRVGVVVVGDRAAEAVRAAALEGVRVESWPADDHPIWANSPYADGIPTMLMLTGDLQLPRYPSTSRHAMKGRAIVFVVTPQPN